MAVTKARPHAVADDAYTRFLAAAEELFSNHGYEGAKIRAIATLSSANLGMLSHHWGSKQALYRDVFERRLKPIHDEQIRRLSLVRDRVERGEAITALDVLKAQIEPMFLADAIDAGEARRLRVLYGRAMTDPSQEVVEAMGEIFADVGEMFLWLLRRACPDIDHTEFYWRANCVVGAFSFVESYSERLTRFIKEDLSEVDWEQAANQVIACLAAGMDAPPAGRPQS